MAINVENYFEQKLKFDQKTNPAKTLDQVKADFQKAGVSAEEHYKKWGWAELLSLDTDFDVAQYLADKAALDGKTVDQVIADFKKAGVNPQEHYENWGKGEGLTPVAVGATPGEGEEPGTPNTLTEALDAYQEAAAIAEEKEAAIGELLEEETYSADNNAASVTAAEGEVLNAQADLDAAVAERSAARKLTLTDAKSTVAALSADYGSLASVTDTTITATTMLSASNVTKIVAAALADVKADKTANTGSNALYQAWAKAKNDLSAHIAKNGSDEAVAKALNSAIVAYLTATGDDSGEGDLASVRAAFVAEEVKASPDWSAVLAAAAAAFVVTKDADGKVTNVQFTDDTAPSDLEAPNGALTKAIVDALKNAAVSAVDRGDLANEASLTGSSGAGKAFAADTKGALYVLALKLEEDFAKLDEAVAEEQADLKDAQDALAALLDLVADFDAAKAAADKAFDILEELGVESLVDIEDQATLGVADTAELFLFTPSDVLLTASIELEVGDQIFLGTKFVHNETADLSKKEGDASALEVFINQEGFNTIVSVEQTTFGSNAKSPELHVITLVGVDAENVVFDGGYITITA